MRELLAAAWLLYLFEYGRQQIAVAAAYVVFMRLLVRKATWYQDPNRPLSLQGMLDRFTDDIFVKLHRFTKEQVVYMMPLLNVPHVIDGIKGWVRWWRVSRYNISPATNTSFIAPHIARPTEWRRSRAASPSCSSSAALRTP